MRRRVLAMAVLAAVGLLVTAGAVATLGGIPSTAMQSDHDDGGHDHGGHGDGGHGDGGMDMEMVPNGTIVNENVDELPPGCDEIAGEREVTIQGGVEHSEAGEMYSFGRDRLELEQCTAVTVTFVNQDDVRHQWMIHGLPAETYPMGMFNIEVNGPASVTATFVTPGADTTLHTHCSLPQHEQKGMAMAVVVGEGGDEGNHGHHDDGDGGGDHSH